MFRLLRGLRGSLALVVTVLLSATLGVVGAGVAHADLNDKIDVQATSIIRVDNNGQPHPNKQLVVSARASVTFTYDASAADPQPGDYFTLGLPPELRVLEIGAKRDLMFQGVKVGECELAERLMTCTFNDAIQGKTAISGGGEIGVAVTATTTTDKITFTANGTKQLEVTLPEGPILPNPVAPFKYTPLMSKWPNSSLMNSKAFTWNILFNASRPEVTAVVPGAPDNMTEIRFIDTTVAPGATEALHVFDTDPAKWRLYRREAKTDTEVTYTQVANLADGSNSTKYPGFNIQVEFLEHNAAGQPIKARITATGPFQPDTNYYVMYDTKPLSETGTPVAGFAYANNAALDYQDSKWVYSASAIAVDTFKVTITMKDGFGGFEVLKKVQGSGLSRVEPGTKFTVNAAWTLPNGKTPADYPDWSAPANPVPVEIEVGKTTTYDGTFPVGTKIVLTEDPNSANPGVSVDWGAPSMTVGSQTAESASFTIANQKSTAVEITNTASLRPSVSVGDYVWFDTNADGLQDGSDQPLKDVELKLTGPDGGQVTDINGNVVGNTTTDADGKYLFSGLPVLQPGQKYTVTVIAPEGYVPTKAETGDDRSVDSSTGSAASGDLTSDGASDTSLDFGFVKAAVSVGDFVWEDLNKDGLQDDGEPGIKGVELKLTGPDGREVTDVNGNVVGNTTTDADGRYSFDGLPVLKDGQSYTVSVVAPPAGFTPTKVVADPRDRNSSTDSASSEGLTSSGERDATLDFGFIRPAVSVGDYVWYDVNKDGLQDDTDRPIAGADLKLTGPDGGEVTDINGNVVGNAATDADGKYLFTGLPVLKAGEKYTVTVVSVPGDYIPTQANVGDDAGVDSSTAKESSGDLTTDGASDMSLDFGFIRPAVSVGDYVWYDLNKDGKQDQGEPGIKDVVVQISDEEGNPVKDINGNDVAPIKTDENGRYSFEELPARPQGHYTVTVVEVPGDYLPTKPGIGERHEDSSTGSADSVALPNDGDRDDTLDFGFIRPSVSVGDYVWFDVNRDGLQDGTDQPLAGVELTLTGPDGKPVTDVFGNPVAPVKTDAQGKYLFQDLPVLLGNQAYTVTVTTPAGYLSTLAGVGSDPALDSSTAKASSISLTRDGDSDLSLDFGFVKPVEPVKVKPGLPATGA